METFLYIVFFVSCVVLIISVLLQPGKTDAGALFTSGVSSAALNPRGTASVLSKLTIAAAAVFMISALFLSMPALTGKVSVLDTQAEKSESPAANTNADSANSNTGTANSSTPANSSSGSNSDAGQVNTSKASESKETTKPEEKSAGKSDDKQEDKKK